MSRKLIYLFAILNLYFTQNAANSVKMKHMDLIKTFENLQSLDRLKNLNTTLCGIHLREYLKSLKLEQYWALQMFDSSPKIPYSLLMGNQIILGNYDECVEAEHPEHLFTGQHCMLTVNIIEDVDRTWQPAFDIIQKKAEKPLMYSVCVPSTCMPEDVINILNSSTNNSVSEFPITLNQEDCQTKNPPRQLRLIDWIAIVILGTVGVLALLSTFYDIYMKFHLSQDNVHPLLISFSIYSNAKNLFQITKNSEYMKSLDGLRVLSMFWVVLSHVKSQGENSSINPFRTADFGQEADKIVLTNPFPSVDTFFFLSGLLVCMVFFRNISKKGYYDAPLQFIHRYIRLTPSFAAIILITVSIFKYFGDGPLWIPTVNDTALDCEKYWWTGILYISNFINPEDICMKQTWYTAADMQLYFFSPLILFPLYLWPSFAASFLGIILLVSACTSFGIAYSYDLSASNLFNTTNRWHIDYVKFYTRSSPYLIGIATGYMITQMRAIKTTLKLNKIYIVIGWLLTTGFCLGVLFGVLPFQQFQYPRLENSLYISLYRVAWGLGTAWIVFACVNGFGGFVNDFLSWNLFEPLGKLTYNAYLLNALVQIYIYGNSRTISYFGSVEIVFSMFGMVSALYLLAIPFTLLFEMPFGNVGSYFFRNVKILPYPKQRKIYVEEKEMKESNSSLENNRQNNEIVRF